MRIDQTMKLIETDSIRDIDAAQWDTVTGDLLSMTHRWLCVTETHWNFYRPHYILLEDAQGPCVAIVADVYVSFKDLGLLGWLRQGLSLAVRPPLSSFCGVMVRPDRSLDVVMSDLEPVLGQLCRQEKRLLITVSNVGASDLSRWQQAGFLASPQPKVSSLDVPETYEQYLASLRAKDRNELRRAHRRGEKFELRFETAPLADDGEQIFALLCEVFARHDTPREAVPFTPQFLAAMQEALAEDMFFVRGYAGEKLVGVSLCLQNGTSLWVPTIGLHYEIARPSYLYFLLIDETIRWAIDHGIQSFSFGKTNERVKQRHGFHLEERWLCYRARLGPLNRILSSILPWVQH
jgi:predicted N-acyltransferase